MKLFDLKLKTPPASFIEGLRLLGLGRAFPKGAVQSLLEKI